MSAPDINNKVCLQYLRSIVFFVIILEREGFFKGTETMMVLLMRFPLWNHEPVLASTEILLNTIK